MRHSKHYKIERRYVERKGTREERKKIPEYHAEFHLRPIAYVSQGVWKDISFKIFPNQNIYTNLAWGFDEFITGGFPDELEDGGILYRVLANKTDLSMSLVGAQKSKAKIELIDDEEWIVYKNALPGTNIRMKNSGHCIPVDLYLESGHPQVFRFKLNMNVASHLTEGGDIMLPTGMLPHPVMSYLPGLKDPDKYQDEISLKWQVKGDEIVIVLPDGDFKDWMIDPTYTTQPGAAAGLDTWIAQANPGTNYGTSIDWQIRISTVGVTVHALIKFDMSPIPAGSTITQMVFHYYWDNGGVNMTNTAMTRQLAVDPWTESGATWNNYDGVNAWAGGAPGNTRGVDISNNDLWAGQNNAGVGWRIRTFNLAEAQILFDANNGWRFWRTVGGLNIRHSHRSSDDANAATRPILVVDYTPPASDRLADYMFDIWDPEARIFDGKGAIVNPNELRADTWMSVLGLDMPGGKQYYSYVEDPGKTKLVSVRASEKGARIVPNPNEFADVIIKRAGAGI